jgi:REP element-mobilizing transposase RayT
LNGVILAQCNQSLSGSQTLNFGKLYSWTATINNWYKLLQEDAFKEIIISSLKHLSVECKIEVYAFVVMPKHLHFI